MMLVQELNATHIGKTVVVTWGGNSLTGVLRDIRLQVEEERLYMCDAPTPRVVGITLQVGSHQIYLGGTEAVEILP